MNKLTKDRLGGALLVATGVAAVVAGAGYGIGSLRAMGSGFYPVALGVLLALIGGVLLATASRDPDAHLATAPAETAHLAGPSFNGAAGCASWAACCPSSCSGSTAAWCRRRSCRCSSPRSATAGTACATRRCWPR